MVQFPNRQQKHFHHWEFTLSPSIYLWLCPSVPPSIPHKLRSVKTCNRDAGHVYGGQGEGERFRSARLKILISSLKWNQSVRRSIIRFGIGWPIKRTSNRPKSRTKAELTMLHARVFTIWPYHSGLSLMNMGHPLHPNSINHSKRSWFFKHLMTV